MKYFEEFKALAERTGFKENQHFLLWRTWRFEKASYMTDVLDEFFAINPKCKNVKGMFKPERTNIGVFLQKYRRLRNVTVEGTKDNLYNIKQILHNCDIEHDDNLEAVYFPLVFTRCDQCHRTVKKFQSEGVWCCICGNYWIDQFYNTETIMNIWGIKDQTKPDKAIKQVEKSLGNDLPF